MDSNRPAEIHSPFIQEVITKMPSWVIRWGIFLIFVIVMMVLIMSNFIKYPEIIPCKITISTQNPPLSIIAYTNGRIKKLFVKDRQQVSTGEYLGEIENNAELEDVLKAKGCINKIYSQLQVNDSILKFEFPQELKLGDLQNDYNIVKQSLYDYAGFLDEKFELSKIRTIDDQIGNYRELFEKNDQIKRICIEEYSIAEKKYLNQLLLHEKGLVSETDLLSSKDELMKKESELRNSESNIITNDIAVTELKKNILEIKQQFDEKKRNLKNGLKDAIKKFDNSFKSWEQKFILKTPTTGTVSIQSFSNENQFVNSGNSVIDVIPSSSEMVGKMLLPLSGSGKVRPGQCLIIKLDNYPYSEFGTLNGVIESISLMPKDNWYSANVILPNGIKTNYDKILEYKQEMSGMAEVITEDLTLFDRMTNQFRALIVNKN